MAPPVLWQFRFSHFNEKARWALDWKGIAHVRRSLLPGFHVPRVLWMTGQKSVPVLVLDRETIHDSTRIIERLERLRPEPALYPADDAARRRALALEDFFDEELGRLEAELHPSGYLVGDRFSVADLTAAALLAPVVFLPPEFPYAPPGPLPAPVARWREAFAGRRASHWAAEMYRRHRGTSAEIAA